MDDSKQLLFDMDDRLPALKYTLPMALQHLVAMIVGCVTPAIIISSIAGLNNSMRILLIQSSLVCAALSTLLQLFGITRFCGARLPLIMGVSFAYLATMQDIASTTGIATIFGAQMLSLYPFPVVVFNVTLYGAYEAIPTVEFLSVVHLPLEYSPEAFHRAIVDAMGNPGHAVDASMTLHKHIELRTRILEAPVAMAERMGIRLFQECLLECIHDDWIVVAIINPICDYPPVIEIQYSTEV